MKKVKLKMPVSKADSFAVYCLENGINTVLSWSVSDFFDTSLYVVAGVTPEQETPFLASPWKQFIIQ